MGGLVVGGFVVRSFVVGGCVVGSFIVGGCVVGGLIFLDVCCGSCCWSNTIVIVRILKHYSLILFYNAIAANSIKFTLTLF